MKSLCYFKGTTSLNLVENYRICIAFAILLKLLSSFHFILRVEYDVVKKILNELLFNFRMCQFEHDMILNMTLSLPCVSLRLCTCLAHDYMCFGKIYRANKIQLSLCLSFLVLGILTYFEMNVIINFNRY